MKNYKRINILLGWFSFAVSAVVYLMTTEPSASLWDCGEFIPTSYKLEVGHPPGAPLFMMLARLFTMLAVDTAHVAFMANAMSCIAAALTIMFLFWVITHLGRRLTGKRLEELSAGQFWTVMGAGLVGALAYAFTDTFWFSAVEAEVYALSSLFTAVVFWAMLKWEDVADEPHSNRWLVLIAYLMGLSIGVHILNLLTIPALVFVYYFRKTEKITGKGVVWATVIAAVLLLFINSIIIPYTTAIGALFDRFFTNTLGFSVNRGIIFFVLLLTAALCWGVWYTYKHGKVLWNTVLLCLSVILIGYSSYASVVIRAEANPPMNSNDPSDPYSLLYFLNRDQYGGAPLVYGTPYSAPVEDFTYKNKYFVGEDGKYKKARVVSGYVQPDEFKMLFPRMWSSRNDNHTAGYEAWGQISGDKKVRYGDELITVPTMGENLRYFFSYQLNFMYWRYFLWNFVGRQSDNQSTGSITDGQWLSGIKAIDEIYLGPQEGLPEEMAENKGRNTYYFLPFLLGILGLLYQLNRDPKNFSIVMWLFVMMGIMLVVYFNTTPAEPRERDYVYAGSFYAFCIWIGLGVIGVKEYLSRWLKQDGAGVAVAATLICCIVPGILVAQNWDDHDRSGRYVMRDMGYNYLMSALPNSILMNYGDNDTFPLWYNQEVENIRPDVRIMNLSYLGGGWYAEEMKWKYNESDPVPFSIPREKLFYNNDYIYIQELFDYPVDLKQAMKVVMSDDEKTKIRFSDQTAINFIPARKLYIPVNKENVLKSGLVKPEDADLIVDTLFFELQGSTVEKPDILLLDLLSNYDWSRPLCFTQASSLRNLGLMDYLQYDGFTYRFVPIKTPYESSWTAGRVDADDLYDKLMNMFRYGNVKDEDVYIDNFSRYNLFSSQIRLGFSRLADEFTARGEKEKALEILDRGVAELPFTQLPHNYQTLAYIDSYYRAGAPEKADALLMDYATNLTEYILYYLSFPDSKMGLISADLDEKYQLLAQLYHLANDNDRKELADALRAYFEE